MIYRKVILTVSILFFSHIVYTQDFQKMSNLEKEQVQRLTEMASMFMNDDNMSEAGDTYGKIAFIYWKAGHVNDAISNFNIASELYLQKNRYDKALKAYTNIAALYAEQEELNFALEYFNKSLVLRRKIGGEINIAAGLIDVAYISQLMRFYDDAIKALLEALKLATEVKNTRLILDCYQLLSVNYELAGNLKLSEEYVAKAATYQEFIQKESSEELFADKILETQQDVVRSEEEKRLAAELFRVRQQLFEQTKDSMSLSIMVKEDSLAYASRLAKQSELEIENLNQHQRLQELEIKEQKAKGQMIAIALVLMVLLAVFMFLANRARRRINRKLEQRNKEIAEKSELIEVAMTQIKRQKDNITSSINYAKNIQKALLPKIGKLNDLIEDSFILFKPRDIVSGDFYWFKEVDAESNIFKIFGMHGKQKSEEQNSGQKIIVSAVDCTGHGVPGAFMSMIGYNLLDEISSKGIIRPDLMLEALHQSVRNTLKQEETNNQDGMDMALCVIDPVRKVLEFSGAKNPLVYIKNGEVNQIKGSKSGIGGKDEGGHFEVSEVVIDEPTWFYIFSDGFIDQFGGDEGRKYMIKNFRNKLLEIHKKPFSEQKDILEKELKDWMGDEYYQIDDVLVIGFKLDL